MIYFIAIVMFWIGFSVEKLFYFLQSTSTHKKKHQSMLIYS